MGAVFGCRYGLFAEFLLFSLVSVESLDLLVSWSESVDLFRAAATTRRPAKMETENKQTAANVVCGSVSISERVDHWVKGRNGDSSWDQTPQDKGGDDSVERSIL